MSTPKRPRDPNQLGKLMVDIATGQKKEADSGKKKGHKASKKKSAKKA